MGILGPALLRSSDMAACFAGTCRQQTWAIARLCRLWVNALDHLIKLLMVLIILKVAILLYHDYREHAAGEKWKTLWFFFERESGEWLLRMRRWSLMLASALGDRMRGCDRER